MAPRSDTLFASNRRLDSSRTSGTMRRKNVDAAQPDMVNVMQIIQDAYYYTGFMQLAKYTVFLAMGVIMLLFHVSAVDRSKNTPYFRTSVTNRLATQYSQDDMAWNDVQTFHDASLYYQGFLSSLIKESNDIDLPKGYVKIGEYGNITYARIIVNFEENCNLAKNRDTTLALECIRSNATALKMFNTTVDKYRSWHTSAAKFYKFRSAARTSSEWHALVVISDVNNRDRSWYEQKMNESLTADHISVLSRYAYSVGFDILAQNSLDPSDYAIFSLRAQRSGSGKGIDTDAFKKLSITTPGKRYLYESKRDELRRVVEILFWIAFSWVVGLDYIQFRLSRRQGHSITAYFRHFWNVYNWITNLLLTAWFIWYMVLWGSWARSYHSELWPTTPLTCDDFYEYEFYSAFYVEWVYVGLGFMLLVGMRMLQFTRLHPGVRVFHDVFSKTMRDLMDFFAVFIFILTLFGTCVYMIFQLNGGNPNWLTWSGGTSVLSRLAFQYGDYSEVYNDAIGAGRWAPVLTLVFWLSVAFLYIWSGNIFLSAVSYAYECVREKNPQVEVFFLFEIFYRVYFLFVWFYWMLIGYHIHQRKPFNRSTTSLNASFDPESGNGNGNSGGGFGGGPFPMTRNSSNGTTPSPSRQASGNSVPDSVPSSTPGIAEESGTDPKAQAAAQGGFRNLPLIKTLQNWFTVVVDQYNVMDIAFYKVFAVRNPAKFPRRYMLCRWALASRPEMKAVAAYFTDFRRFRLAEANAEPEVGMEAHSGAVLMHLEGAVKGSVKDFMVQKMRVKSLQKDHHGTLKVFNAQTKQYETSYEMEANGDRKVNVVGLPDFITRGQLAQLIATVQAAHDETLSFASIPFVLPQRLTQYFLGYFWGHHYQCDIPKALSEVYDPDYMKMIESSFDIDEDEDGALTTRRDLKAEVVQPISSLECKVVTLERELGEMKDMLRQLLALSETSLPSPPIVRLPDATLHRQDTASPIRRTAATPQGSTRGRQTAAPSPAGGAPTSLAGPIRSSSPTITTAGAAGTVGTPGASDTTSPQDQQQ